MDKSYRNTEFDYLVGKKVNNYGVVYQAWTFESRKSFIRFAMLRWGYTDGEVQNLWKRWIK